MLANIAGPLRTIFRTGIGTGSRVTAMTKQDFCFTDLNNPGKYCCYPTAHTPYGNWKLVRNRYDNCGSKCTNVT